MAPNWLDLFFLLVLGVVSLGSVCVLDAVDRGYDVDAVVVEREDVCVVGRNEAVEARYCAHLALKDIGTGEGFLGHLNWLRLENSQTLVQNINKTRPLDEVYLSNWAWKLHGEGRLMELVDPSLSLQGNEQLAMQRLINVSLLCSQHEAEQRPTMARVVAMLQHDTQFEVVVLNSSSQSGGTSSPHEEVDTMRLLAFKGCNLTISGELPGIGLQRYDSWPSIFSVLGTSNPKVERRRSFLSNWLAARAPLWLQELSPSQWQVHQRSVILVPPQDKRKSLFLTYCELALSSSLPKCALETDAGRKFDHPENSQLRNMTGIKRYCNLRIAEK